MKRLARRLHYTALRMKRGGIWRESAEMNQRLDRRDKQSENKPGIVKSFYIAIKQ
jgi:hypothetical protein